MKKHVAVLLLAILCAALLAAAPRGRQELVQPGSWIYDALAAMAMESGRTDFSDQAPLTIQELELYLHEADYDALSPAGKAQYDRITDYIADGPWAFSAGLLSLGAEPEASLEFFYKTNDGIDWVYGQHDRQPLLTVPLTFLCGDLFTLSMDVDLQENVSAMRSNDNFSNFPLPTTTNIDVDSAFPNRAYGSVGHMLSKDTGVNFRMGLGSQSVGRSLMGSIIMSDSFVGASYANLTVFSPNIRYTMNVTQFNVDKYMYTHRMDVRFFKKFEFTAMEALLVHAPLELRYLNPLTIFHGMSAWEDYSGHEHDACDYLAVKLAFTPGKYLRLYGMFAQDQLQTIYERMAWPDDTTPNGISVQAGAESYIPYRDGYLHFWLEGSYTDPFMYIKEDPNWTMVRTYRDNVGDPDAIYYAWVGSPHGPDTIAGELKAGYEVPGRWSVTASYLFKACGEYSGLKVFTEALSWGGRDTEANLLEWAYPKPERQGQDEAKRRQSLMAPSGTPEFVNRIAVRVDCAPTPYLSFGVQPAVVLIFNHGNISGEFAGGFEVAATSTIRFTRIRK